MRDLRRYAQQTQTRLIFGGLLLLYLVGDGLVYIFYGRNAAVAGLICLTVGLIPLGLIVLVLWLMDWMVKHANRK
ncbi:MAG TPA: hypothetical protein VHO48_07205 [Anaerolineaceae bacterium]|nr:hypothetical protein [Anaerolineaceae bacterium]